MQARGNLAMMDWGVSDDLPGPVVRTFADLTTALQRVYLRAWRRPPRGAHLERA